VAQAEQPGWSGMVSARIIHVMSESDPEPAEAELSERQPPPKCIVAWAAMRTRIARHSMTSSSSSSDERIQSYEQRLDVHGSEPAFNEDGVDLTQIRESLRRTPYERLVIVQNWVESLQSVRVIRGPR